jgi:tetratricopeptide (TPR) repeat protein
MDKAVDLRPESNDLWMTRGLVLDNNEKYDEALTCYDLVLKRDGKNKHAWNLRGLVLTKLGRHGEAVENFNMALSVDDQDKVVWYNKGIAWLDDARYDDSLECFKKALDLDPNYKDGLIGLGLVQVHREQYILAENTFKAALDKDPRDARTWGHLGDALVGMGRFESAVESYDEALALAAHNVEFMKKKSNALARLGDYHSVLETLERIIDIGKDDKEVWKVKGDMLLKEEQYDRAIDAYSKAIEKGKGYLEAAEGKRKAEELHAMAKLENHAREILNFEATHGKRPTKEEAFKDCRVPFEHLDKVLGFLDEEEKLEPDKIPKSERQYLENMSLLVIRDCLAMGNELSPEAATPPPDIKNLDLCLVTRAFPELTIHKAKRVLDYIKAVSKAQVEAERSLSPMLEAKVRSVLSIPEEQRTLVNIVLHLNVGVQEAGEVLTVLKALKGEKVRIKGEAQPVAVDMGKSASDIANSAKPSAAVEEDAEDKPKRKPRAPRKPKAKVTEEEEDDEGPEKELTPVESLEVKETKPKAPRGKKKFSTMSLKEQMDALGIQVGADGSEEPADEAEGAVKKPRSRAKATAATEEEEESGAEEEDEVQTKEDVYVPPSTGIKEVEPLIPPTATKPSEPVVKERPKSPEPEAEEEDEEEVPEEPAPRPKRPKAAPSEEETEEEDEEEEEPEEDEADESSEEEEDDKELDAEDDRLRSARLKDLEKHRGGWRDTL